MDSLIWPVLSALAVATTNGLFMLWGRRTPERKDKSERDKIAAEREKLTAEGRDTQVKTEGGAWALYKEALLVIDTMSERLDKAEERIDSLEEWQRQAIKHMDNLETAVAALPDGVKPTITTQRPNGKHSKKGANE